MNPVIETRELTKVFGRFKAVDRLTLQIEPGDICGFLGPNGAGKSTAIRMLCGILTPTAGSATVLGFDLLTESEQIKRHIGYMSQKYSLYDDLTVRENLNFYAGIYSIPNGERVNRIGSLIELTGLVGRETELAANLSGGWKQRLALACALIPQPQIVFLDEPTSGVSPTRRRSFFNIIQALASEGTTVIVTTHFMDEAERCTRIAFISNGRLLAYDTPDNLKDEILEGCLVEVDLPDALDQIAFIERLPFVRECSLHGRFLHVLLKDESDIPALQAAVGGDVRPVSPTLEDVFLALAKRDRK